jgi:3-oxoadipate enol-lactonase
MPTVELNGLPFHIRFDGPEDAPPLILSNSLASNLTMWDDQIPAFAERFRVIRYDQRGHGATAAPPGPYAIADLGRDALALMDAIHLVRAHWCGLSLGGMTGMWLLTHAPHRLERTVLANTAARMGPPDLWNGRIRTATAEGLAALAEGTLERWFTPAFRAEAPDKVARVREMILATPVEGYRGCCAAIRDMDQRERLRQVPTSALVIVGAHDPATTPAAGELIRGAIKRAELVSLDAAHLSNIERPVEFSAAVMSYLTR